MKDNEFVESEQLTLFEMISLSDPETSEIVAWVFFPVTSEAVKNAYISSTADNAA
jgi:hypothetical protein